MKKKTFLKLIFLFSHSMSQRSHKKSEGMIYNSFPFPLPFSTPRDYSLVDILTVNSRDPLVYNFAFPFLAFQHFLLPELRELLLSETSADCGLTPWTDSSLLFQ